MNEVSIIVVSWNTRERLYECLKSICTPLDKVIREVIVVDNGSIDGSSEMVSEQFPEVILIQCSENLGFARANNLGLKRTCRDTDIAFINSDVIVHPGCLKQLVAFLSEHKDVGLVGPKVFGGDGKLQRTCRKLPTVWNTICRSFALDTAFPKWPAFSGREMRHWCHDSLAEVQTLSGCFWLARRETIENVGELDERFFFYAEDVDWCKRCRNAGWKIVFVPEATAIHFGGGSSSRANLRYSIEMVRANLMYWRKHHGALGHATFYFLSIIHYSLRLIGRGLKVVFTNNHGSEAIFKVKKGLVCLGFLLAGKKV